MYYNHRKSKFNIQTLCGYLSLASQFYFIAFLLFEVIFFTFKYASYDILVCIKERLELFVSRNKNEDDHFSPVNSTILDSIQAFCYVNGTQHVNFKTVSKGSTLYEKFVLSGKYAKEYIDSELEMTKQFQTATFMVYFVFILQILMFILQQKLNFFHPVIYKLKERAIFAYSKEDRFQIERNVEGLLRNSRCKYLLVLVDKLIYNSLLIVTIFAFKFILLGQRLREQSSSLDTFLQFVRFPAPDAIGINLENIYSRPYSNLPTILHDIFFICWIIYLVALVCYLVLMFYRLIQFCSRSLRTSSIVSFVGDSNAHKIDLLNGHVSNYYFMHKLARNVDPFWFNKLIDSVSFNTQAEYGHYGTLSDKLDDKLIDDENEIVKDDDHSGDSKSPRNIAKKLIDQVNAFKEMEEHENKFNQNDQFTVDVDDQSKQDQLTDLASKTDREQTEHFRVNTQPKKRRQIDQTHSNAFNENLENGGYKPDQTDDLVTKEHEHNNDSLSNGGDYIVS